MTSVFDFICNIFLPFVFVVLIFFITLHRPSGSFRAGWSNLNGILWLRTPFVRTVKGKGRLRTLSSTVKPGKFEVREGIAIEAFAWVIYITYYCMEYICHDVGQLVAYPLTGRFPGPDGGISEYKLPTSFCIHHI